MSKSFRGDGVRRGVRAHALGCAVSLAAVATACGGRTLGASDYDEGSGSGGAGTRAGATGFGGYAAGTSQGGNSNAAGAAVAGASSAGAPMMAGSGGVAGCGFSGTCDDGNRCTIDGCDNGVCRHQFMAVDDGDACTQDSCDPSVGPSHTPISTDDHDLCTKDTCDPKSGPAHTAYYTSDNNVCTLDICDPNTGSVTHTLIAHDDGNLCTSDFCDPITGMVTHPPNFGDGNQCLVETCAPKTGAIQIMPVDCNDFDPCTVDSCDPGLGCQHSGGGGGLYFTEDFSSNAPGWDFGAGWQVGPAQLSFGQTVGNPDPAQDHSATFDNGIAGVVIGGNASTTQQGPNYLTSPAIDLSNVSGSALLEYWRWLNSDYPPYMTSTIEVFDGNAWINVYAISSGNFVSDNAWTLDQYDITQYKNANFRVRWGWSVGSVGVYSVSSWNIDDVRVIGSSPNTCP